MSKTRMGKRVASLLLSLVMMLSLLPTTVYATGGTGETNGAIVEANTSDDNTVGETTGNPELTGEDEGGGAANVSEGETATVATIGSATYETLDEAIAAVADGETIVVNAGEYTLNGSLAYAGKAFTIAAAEGAKVSFDMSAAVALHGAKITFNNVTFDYKTNGNYIGLQHTDTLVYNNCTINGMVFLYAVNETFNGCTFNQTSAGAYNVWTYGAQNVAFNGCTFNCVGRCVLMYNEGAIDKTDLTVENTEFNASAPVTGKAAIEIDTSLMEGGATITVDDKTTAAGFATGSNSGKTLWNDKKQTADTNKNTTVTVAGETVFEPKATVVKPVSVNGTSYETLEDAIDAATPDANGVVTYEISGKVDVTATGWVQVAKSGLTGLTAVKFVGTTDDAKICINGGLAILADQNYDIDVSFEALALSKLNPTYGGDYGHSTNYFTTWLRNSGAAENTVTYTNCTFPNGVSNNQYGKTVFDNCKFTNGATGLYNLWNYGGSTEIKNSSFTGTRGIKAYSEGVDGGQIEVADTTFNGLGEKAAIVVSKATTVTLNKVDATECTKGLLQKDIDGGSLKTTIEANGTGISGKFDITATTTADAAKNEFNISAGTFTSEVSNDYCADGFEVKANDNGTYGVVEAATADGDGTEANPYTLEQLGAMTRQAYIDAQNRLNGTMYVTVGNYAYDTNGVLGNGVRDDTTGQTPDHSKLNAYGENGYLGEKNDGANGKSVVFVGGSITSGVTGYTSIDKIGTSLLLALPAYTNVTFKGTTFNNVMSFNYQLYTSPWSQLGELKFDNCTFNGIIVGAIAAQTLTFNRCEFKNYTNTTDANSSNPTWIRPAYGNWTQGDNEGQGSDFRSLTTINFTDNKVTSTRPVKFEYISQWDITSTVTATGNSFDISKQDGDTTIKNVGLYLGAHTDANAFNLVAEDNTKSANTAALYTIPEGKTSLPLGSTVKNLAGEPVELTDALKWKAGDATTDKIVLKTVEAVASVGSKQYGSLQAAIDAATAGQTVTLLTDVIENVEIAKERNLTLDLNGKTLNGGTGTAKAALSNLGTITIRDTSEAKTGTIKRDDNGTVGETSYYVIRNQGTMTIESGTVSNNSGYRKTNPTGSMIGSSLICNGDCNEGGTLTIKGGTFTQNNFIAIKNGAFGVLDVTGGTISSDHSAIQNWFKADITGGEIKGQLWTDAWKEGESVGETKIGGDAKFTGEIVMDITGSVAPTLAINGGNLNVTNWRITNAGAKPAVSGGTFTSAVPADYCAEGFIPTANADGTYGVELGNYVVVGGIKGFENTKFASFADAYDAIKPVLEKICANDALGQGTPANADAFDAVFTDVKDGRATLTYTITGNVTYDETGYANLLTMGRRSSHYLTNERHLINFKFVGAEADRGATLTVNSNITLPYEWWGEKITTAISFENLTITGSASNGLYTYQPYFEGIDFTVNNCTLKGIKIYNCANVGGSYTITNSTLDGTGAPAGAYAIHLQGNETAPLNITISGNQISGYDRGINIDQNTAEATISGNTIGINDVNRSCIQLTRLASTEVKDNTLNLNGGNAFTLHKNLAAGSKINIAGNTVDGNGYLIYDDTKNAIDLTYTNNTITGNVDTTKGVYGGNTYALTDGVDVVINGVKAAQIGDVKYETLQAAIDAVKANETIYVLGNIDLGTDELSTYDVKTTVKNVTIDLGGYTVTSAGKYTVYLKVNGWTIQNGTIQNTNASTTYGTLYVGGSSNSTTLKNLTVESKTNGVQFAIASSKNGIKASITVEDGTKISGNYGVYMKGQPKPWRDTRDGQEILNVNGGEITGTTAAIAVFGAGKGNTKAGVIVNINGGKVYSDSYAIAGNGSSVLENTTINISGGKVFSNKDTAIYHPQAGTVTISGGEVYGVTGGVQMCAGTLNVTGGTISATGNGDVSGKTGDGSIPDGAAVSIVNRAYPAGAPTMTISGGTFTSAAGVGAVQAYGWKNNSQQTWDKPNAAVSGGTFSSAVKEEYCATGYIPTANADGTYGVKAGAYVAKVDNVKYETLQAAINAAKRNATVTMLANTRENVTISTPYLTLDLNGFTLNGGTEKGKPALTVTARVTVKDSSTAQTGTIMREDTAENSGVSFHYVIDVQGGGWLTFESGTVKNNSGNANGKGASLVRVGDDRVAKYPGLNIKGGTFTQDNFIVIKVDRGDLFLNGGTLNSKNSYAIEDWHRATIKGGTVNGTVAAWTYSGGYSSSLEISGGTINGDVTSVNCGNADGKKATVAITGGTINGELDTRSYDPKTNKLTSISDATKATIEVTAGTFAKDPTKYLVEGSTVKTNSDGTFGVEKAYLATVGKTSYYTMEEAFKAQTASGEPVVMLRDYTTGSPFNSGTINRTVDLNGYTWTCTGTDTNSAAFEINNPDVTLTVKNGKIVSSQLVGLIPSAMGGTIKYDNAGLVFEDVVMTTTAHSGIETNGNNTNDTVTLKNSTLNVPNGYGIYFPSSGTLTIDNSTINAKTMGVQVCAGSLSINAGSAITVTGDAVPKTENDGAIQDGAAISIVNRTGYKGLGDVTVTGGKFTAKAGNKAIKAYDWANNTETEFTANKTVAVSGGTFSSAVPEGLCAPGFIPTTNGDGTYGVKAGVYVAEVNGVAYATLSEAIAAAKDGDTVKLLRDINTPEISYMISRSLTIDLNGMTVTGSGYDAVFQIDNADAKVVIKNGKVVAVEQSGSAGKYTMAIWASKAGCEVTLEGLDVSQKITHTDDPQMDMIYASGGTITINSGNFVSGTPAWTLNCNDTSYKNGTAKIIVTGGTFVGFDPANNKAEGEGTSFVAAGYVSRMDEDGSYTVVPANAKITVGKRLSIGNDLTITYLVNLTDCTNPWVKFQFYNDDIKGYTTVEVKNYGTATVEGPDGRPVEVFTFDFTGVNPQRMTDTLKATVYAEDASGNVVEYQVADYSVAQYCSNKLAKLGQDDSLRKLIGNLVAYGAAAQVYQNYRTDNLVSTVVSGAVSTDYTDRLSSVTQYTGKVTGAAGVTIKGKTLVLSNTFAVRVYFTVNKGVDIANVSFKVTANGKTDTVNSFEKDEKLGYYYFDYANLNATQLDSEVKFESFVNETGVGDMVTYSVNTYLAKKMPNYDKSSNAYKFMAELFNYGCACTEYASK